MEIPVHDLCYAALLLVTVGAAMACKPNPALFLVVFVALFEIFSSLFSSPSLSHVLQHGVFAVPTADTPVPTPAEAMPRKDVL